MQLEYVSLLEVQRDLYRIPLGMTRFQRYIKVMTGGTDEMVLPLTAMNPMGKPHVAEALEALLAMGAEEVAAAAVEEAGRRLAHLEGRLRVGMVMADDTRGGWTNRYLTEINHRFASKAQASRGWAVALCWTGETWTRERVREEMLAALYRSLYVERHGAPATLGQMMAQEGLAAVWSGGQPPALDADDLLYTRDVIRPYRDTTAFPTVFACLYGDEAARSVGYPPMGLSERAGYAVAWDEARHAALTPDEALAPT
ncbi:MAG TPA: hypothetical protein VLA19_18420 [Herpetosiphonaceae bacterium]|nr:hypothetical protein [Herpetosiphonaceae bacterium]